MLKRSVSLKNFVLVQTPVLFVTPFLRATLLAVPDELHSGTEVAFSLG